MGICQFQYKINFISNGWLITTLERDSKHINRDLTLVIHSNTQLTNYRKKKIGMKEQMSWVYELSQVHIEIYLMPHIFPVTSIIFYHVYG